MSRSFLSMSRPTSLGHLLKGSHLLVTSSQGRKDHIFGFYRRQSEGRRFKVCFNRENRWDWSLYVLPLRRFTSTGISLTVQCLSCRTVGPLIYVENFGMNQGFTSFIVSTKVDCTMLIGRCVVYTIGKGRFSPLYSRKKTKILYK